jgi:hypothetical protein
VSGESGIGKTTLTRAFADSLATHRAIRIGRGQCVDQYGAGEPYLPILKALTRLCREPGGEKLIEILHRIAPAWLTHMPSLVSAFYGPAGRENEPGRLIQRRGGSEVRVSLNERQKASCPGPVNAE